MPDLVTQDDLNVELCVVEGADHDYRIYAYTTGGGRFHHRSYRCIWCHGVACGDVGETDPCWLAYHHATPHRSRAGVVWPLGGNRPDNEGNDHVRI